MRLLCLSWMLAAQVMGGSEAQFGARADVVVVDVAVTRNGKGVANLTPSDFELFDRGVRQTVLGVERASRPLDVLLIVDTSVSVFGDARRRLEAAALEVESMVASDDVLRAYSLGAQAVPTSVGEVVADAKRATSWIGDGGTRLFDGLAFAMTVPARAGYRRVVLMLTDGVDSGSLLAESTLASLGTMSDSVVYVVAVAPYPRGWGMLGLPEQAFPAAFDRALARVVEESGGQLLSFRPDESTADQIKAVFDDLRSSYTLTYSPAGRPEPGWHDLRVTTPRIRGTEVRARRGYFVR